MLGIMAGLHQKGHFRTEVFPMVQTVRRTIER